MKKILSLFIILLLPLLLSAQQNWKAIVRYDKQAAKAQLTERLQKYAAQGSHASPSANTRPTTKEQLAFGKMLVKELKHIGATNVQISKEGVVQADIPTTSTKKLPTLAVVAHYDTTPDSIAMHPQLVAKYTGGDIVLDRNSNTRLTEANSNQLLRAHGHDFVTSAGKAPFGADAKAGLAIAITLADYLLGNTAVQHGPIKLLFLPDSGTHQGAETADIKGLQAQYAYVLDGKDQGELVTSNFAGRNFTAVFVGRRDIALANAIHSTFTDNLLMASDFHTLLPRQRRPETTSGSRGYIMVDSILTQGEKSTVTGHIRAFTEQDLNDLTRQVQQAFDTVKAMNPNRKNADLILKDQFHNAEAKLPVVMLQQLEAAMRQEDIQPKRISVRDNTDAAVLTSRGLPATSVFTGVFHGKESLEYADVDVMEASLRSLMTLLSSWPE